MGEGLRNTISLTGRGGMSHGFLHWSANFDEVQDFEGQIRSFAGGTGLMTDAAFATYGQPLGPTKAGRSSDLDALAAYVTSLNSFTRSPYRNANGSLTTLATQGRTVFQNANCGSCHAGTRFTDSANATLDDVGTIKQPTSGQRLGAGLTGIDPPTLRDVWATAPYLHDGSAATLADAVRAHTGITLSTDDLNAVSAYLSQIGGDEATAPLPPPPGSGGLIGRYFNNTTLSGTPALTRTEVVDFGWGSNAPGPGIGRDNFSVRWTGEVRTTTAGAYYFRTYTDEGVRLWVNGVLLIDNWTPHASATTDTSNPVNLAANTRYTITMEYYDLTRSATARLRWRIPNSSSYVVVPGDALFSN
jgi:mono/diheme cytochrome c family protein